MKVWALVEFTHNGEVHEPGAEFDMPRNSDQEKHDFARWVDNGVITTKPSQVEPAELAADEQSGSRSGRSRRN